MKASYIIALFAAVAVANAWESGSYTDDSKVQVQKASGTGGKITDNSNTVVSANGLAEEGANVLSTKKVSAGVGQKQDMH
ncbi:hypothetical protein BDA99DRAFT_557842 [Phascolomyces articulosus]|uniref:Uncharacterized protein n=1 Tax=Phascolomyces articulosus TaxID=60185 RepID=A0AAD5KFM6_9FUNG|nr:hypothetical protein BDA99DRAFT_557842 [Phascolomyces articulosus]